MELAKSEMELMQEVTSYLNQMEDEMAKLRSQVQSLEEENAT